MFNIIISGANGFVGTNWISYSQKIPFYKNKPFERDDIIKDIDLTSTDKSVFLHLAGKAHDTKKLIDSKVYYEVNTALTNKLFDDFLQSEINTFIMISSVKAVADHSIIELTEDVIPKPITDYGKSKLLSEKYILSKQIPEGKRVFILRPCMIHGPGNKGNFNLLFNFIQKGIPWPLGAFDNKRTFCSIDNLCFIIKELIERDDISSAIFNIADDQPVSTNELISIIATSLNKKTSIVKIPQFLIKSIAQIGDILRFPLNSERLQKLTESYIVSNKKIKNALGKELPISSKGGLLKTFKSFNDLNVSTFKSKTINTYS